MLSEQFLVWIDLEMTGLNPSHDVILEIATIITNNNMEIVAEGPAFIIHHPDTVLDRMNDKVKSIHDKSGLTLAVKESKISLEQAQRETLLFVQQHCAVNSAPLCGNSIYVDRSFLREYMPDLDNYLHYRIIDVSSIKELVRRWYPKNSNKNFKKPENHRALEDIKGSISELEHYKKYFFIICE